MFNKNLSLVEYMIAIINAYYTANRSDGGHGLPWQKVDDSRNHCVMFEPLLFDLCLRLGENNEEEANDYYDWIMTDPESFIGEVLLPRT
jgi:hypothetical protein